MCDLAAQLFLLPHQTLQFAALLIFSHLVFPPRQIALCPGQTLLAPRELFQFVDLLLILLRTSPPGVGRFIAVLQLAHFHFKKLSKILALLLRRTPTTATTALLHADIRAINVCFCLKDVLQSQLFGLKGTGNLHFIQLTHRQIHLLNSQRQILDRRIIGIV